MFGRPTPPHIPSLAALGECGEQTRVAQTGVSIRGSEKDAGTGLKRTGGEERTGGEGTGQDRKT